jgi:hypothetical protein
MTPAIMLQVFPYFYVRCGHALPQTVSALNAFLETFENSLNTALEHLVEVQRDGDCEDPGAAPCRLKRLPAVQTSILGRRSV